MNGPSTFYLDVPSQIIRATVEYQNYHPSDGYSFMKVTHLPTNKVLKDFEIYPKPSGNDMWAVQIAYPILESDIKVGGQALLGEYEIHIRSELGSQTASTKFSILESADNTAIPQSKPETTTQSQSNNQGKVSISETNFMIEFHITDGNLISITPDVDANSLIIAIDATDDGQLTITLPRELIDAKIGDKDDDFLVLVDRKEMYFDETTTSTDRTLVILFPAGAEEIEIIGTNSFAQSDEVPFLTVRTDDNHYDEGDTVVISGKVSSVIPDAPIILQLWYEGNLLDAAQFDPAQDGSYSHTIIAEKPLLREEGEYLIRVSHGEGNIAETTITFRNSEPNLEPIPKLKTEPDPELELSSKDKKIIFEERTREILTTISTHKGVNFRLELERDFDKEYEEKNASYHLYKMFDTKRNDRTGDLRIYLGSSDWWNEKAELQEDDKSGYENIFKVQIYLQHLTDPEQSQDYALRIANLIKILVPEWSRETSTVSIDQWTSDVINNAPRNADDKREDSVIIENKEVRLLSDDVFWGSITLIVTENFDKTKSNYAIPESKSFDEIISSLGETTDTPPKTTEEQDQGGGCLIATATYGSELAPQVQQLRELRDNKLLQTESGSVFMESFNDFYYSFSPVIADYERENPYFKEAVKLAITPMISSLSILNYVDMETDAEVLGYGISLVLLNVGMYVGVPAIVVVGIRKVF